MKTLTLKLPKDLLEWVETEARKSNRPKSALIRDILKQHRETTRKSAVDLAADLCGCVSSGLCDLSRNMKRLRGFGK